MDAHRRTDTRVRPVFRPGDAKLLEENCLSRTQQANTKRIVRRVAEDVRVDAAIFSHNNQPKLKNMRNFLFAVTLVCFTANQAAHAVTIDFDKVYPSSFSSSGASPIVQPPSVDRAYDVPNGSTGNFFAAYNAGDATSTTVANIGFGAVYNSFSVLWGTVDSYNTLAFLLNGNTVFTVNGTTAAGNLVNTNSTITYATSGFRFDSIRLTTVTNAFEIDNINLSTPVPDDSVTAVLLGLAMVGLVAVRAKLSVA